MLAVDGTKLKAVNGSHRNYTRAKLAKAMAENDERLARYLAEMDEADASDGSEEPPQHIEKLEERIASIRTNRAELERSRAALEASGEAQISLTDPDARAMQASSRIGVGYNAQIAVDAKHRLIAEAQVHNKVSDLGLLCVTAEAAKRTLGVEAIEVVADRGYYKIEDIQACEDAGISAYVAKPIRGPGIKAGYFAKDDFDYNAEADTFTCPGGETLSPRYREAVRGTEAITYVNRAACRACDLRPRCTKAKFRKVMRYEGEAVLDRMAERLADRPDVMALRKGAVEHPFGSIKHWMGHRHFLTRRLPSVRAEFSLTALAYNIRRAITLVGVRGLIRAAEA
jgi:transposase